MPTPRPSSTSPTSDDPATNVDRLLAAARARIAPRLAVAALEGAIAAGALVVDTRPEELRRRDGPLPGAVVVERNVLEWRLDPTCPHRLAGMDDPNRPVVVVCDEGYASSLAAAALLDLGLTNVTDLAGGFQAWAARRNPPGAGPSGPDPAGPPPPESVKDFP